MTASTLWVKRMPYTPSVDCSLPAADQLRLVVAGDDRAVDRALGAAALDRPRDLLRHRLADARGLVHRAFGDVREQREDGGAEAADQRVAVAVRDAVDDSSSDRCPCCCRR